MTERTPCKLGEKEKLMLSLEKFAKYFVFFKGQVASLSSVLNSSVLDKITNITNNTDTKGFKIDGLVITIEEILKIYESRLEELSKTLYYSEEEKNKSNKLSIKSEKVFLESRIKEIKNFLEKNVGKKDAEKQDITGVK
ncbi:MAG: hypothetical protein K9L98_03360 [Candidatus Pacebacteria bacterium]|nr:hypothetical protein [Candidatus Paceibacterota bacterium]MCF7863017.1 hypothetical protein [Candidatus Paceibacterota bacterium]